MPGRCVPEQNIPKQKSRTTHPLDNESREVLVKISYFGLCRVAYINLT
jgi:hypothetical protein